MIIKEIQIDNFGHFHDFRISNLGKGVNEIAGLNEFGKSTIAEFIVRIFYGFPDKRRGLNPYPAACDDVNYGGRLICELADGREIIIERLGKNKKSRFLIIDNQTKEELSSADIFSFDENFYREIYALTLQQLAKGGVLEEQDNAISRRLYGINYASKNIDINGLIKSLNERSDKIFLPAGRSQQMINQYELLTAKKLELESLTNSLRQSEKLDLEIAELELKLKEISSRCQVLSDFLSLENKLREEKEKLAEIKQAIDKIVYNENFLANERVIEELSQSLKLYQEYHNNLLVSKIELETLEKELKNNDNEFQDLIENEKFQHNLMDFGLREEQATKRDKEAGDYNARLVGQRNHFLAIIQMFAWIMILAIGGGFFMLNFGNMGSGKFLIVAASVIFVLLMAARVLLLKIMKLHSTNNLEKLEAEFIEFLQPFALEQEYSITSAVNRFMEAKKLNKEHEKLVLVKSDFKQKTAKLEEMEEKLKQLCRTLDKPFNEEKSYVETVEEIKNELKHYREKMVKKHALIEQFKQQESHCNLLAEKIQQATQVLQKSGLENANAEKLQELKKEFFSLNAQTAVKRNEYTELLGMNEFEVVNSDFDRLKNQLKKMAEKYL